MVCACFYFFIFICLVVLRNAPVALFILFVVGRCYWFPSSVHIHYEGMCHQWWNVRPFSCALLIPAESYTLYDRSPWFCGAGKAYLTTVRPALLVDYMLLDVFLNRFTSESECTRCLIACMSIRRKHEKYALSTDFDRKGHGYRVSAWLTLLFGERYSFSMTIYLMWFPIHGKNVCKLVPMWLGPLSMFW